MRVMDNELIETVESSGIQEARRVRRTRLLAKQPESTPAAAALIYAPIVGKLVAVANQGRTPLVRYQGQPGHAALEARTLVDLHAAHVGSGIVLMFERGDPTAPVIMGLLRDAENLPSAARPGHVEIDVDGESLIVAGKEQVVIRCGKASITLTKAGKVVIEGEYVINRARKTNRIEGGAVQIN